jgi:hypothetical protein
MHLVTSLNNVLLGGVILCLGGQESANVLCNKMYLTLCIWTVICLSETVGILVKKHHNIEAYMASNPSLN